MFTIGMGLSETDIYARTLLNPNATNVNAASETNNNTNAHKLVDYLKSGNNPYSSGYSYADGSYMGEMDATRLSGILSTITQTITNTYTEEDTRTTNIKRVPAKYELVLLDTDKPVTIKLDNNDGVEYTVLDLIHNDVIVVENEKYYIDLNASIFNNIKSIEITYYELHTINEEESQLNSMSLLSLFMNNDLDESGTDLLLAKIDEIDKTQGEIKTTKAIKEVVKEEKLEENVTDTTAIETNITTENNTVEEENNVTSESEIVEEQEIEEETNTSIDNEEENIEQNNNDTNSLEENNTEIEANNTTNSDTE